jgi:hypothetical protein
MPIRRRDPNRETLETIRCLSKTAGGRLTEAGRAIVRETDKQQSGHKRIAALLEVTRATIAYHWRRANPV